MAKSKPPRLLDQVREVARLKHFSLSTEKSYVYRIRDYILFHNKRHPKDMGVLKLELTYRTLPSIGMWQRQLKQ